MHPHNPIKLTRRGAVLALACPLALAALPVVAADGAQALRDFVERTRSGRADFSQTVTAPDGRRKASSGVFEFQRPGRFRFEYRKPFAQLIVADGQRVWIHDPDLSQATARPQAAALGATPAALLAGGSLENDFTLAADGSADGLDWVRATPKARDGALQSVRVGFRGGLLAALEIADSFGQRSLLRFERFEANAAIAAERFRFVPPAGTDVVEQR